MTTEPEKLNTESTNAGEQALAEKQKPEQDTHPESEKTKEEKKFTQAELDAIIKDRLQREKEKRDKDIETAKAKAEEDKLKEQGEYKKLAEEKERKLAEAEAKLAAKELAEKKAAIAKKVGLPDGLAARLIGNDDAELEADAKALLETLPKGSKTASMGATNPGSNSDHKMTHQEALMAMTGQIDGEKIFDAEYNKAHGGGIIYGSKKED